MVKYSFVLPAYKARFFKEALDSILSQTYKDFELIIVNDASPEDLDSIVKQYDDPRIRYYFNEENIGGKDLVAQWNHCLEYAKGEYVILASDDDVYHPEYLEKMDELVRKYPDVNVYRPRVQYINKNNEIIYTENLLPVKMSLIQYLEAWITTKIGSGIPFNVFKRLELEKQGGFLNYPLGWFSDDATVIEIAKSNGMAYSADTLFSFRCSDINISSKKHTKSLILKKIKATEVFYYNIKQLITNLPTIDNDDLEKKDFLTKRFSYFLSETKIRSQIFNTSLFVVFSILPTLMRLEFLPKKLLFKYYLSHFRSLLLGKYK
ncbi:MAG: glycosyltransferase family 2 protein [Bacteroidaceae bacterium]|nr:glycosyltransferase family 2 protein [Bacteroidaceae bacterium]